MFFSIFFTQSETMTHIGFGKCLEIDVAKTRLSVQPCDAENPRQRWKFQWLHHENVVGSTRRTGNGTVVAAAAPALRVH